MIAGVIVRMLFRASCKKETMAGHGTPRKAVLRADAHRSILVDHGLTVGASTRRQVMRNGRTSLKNTLVSCVLFWLLGRALLATAFAGGLISIEPVIVTPDENGVARFSVAVSGVPAPGFRSYALSVRFDGAAVNLSDTINSINPRRPCSICLPRRR
jgi:hypothetical protein